jgi:hypothetical protein
MSICLKAFLFLFPVLLFATEPGRVDILNGRVTITDGRVAIGPQGPSGLVAWWKADGNALDSSPYGNDGTAYNISYTNGRGASQAFVFANSNAYIDCGNSPSLSNISATLTVAYWWQNSGTNGVAYALLVSKGFGVVSGGAWSASRLGTVTGAGYFFARYADNSGYSYPGLWSSVSLNFWRHHAHVIDSSSGKWRTYVNGLLIAESDNTNSVYQNALPVQLGGASQPAIPSSWFNGTLDDIRIYNRALASNEVFAVYQEGL